jgi:hypothetical protein
MNPIIAALFLHAAVPYTAHEWGTFTAVVAEDGKPRLWSPLRYKSDLPSFVQVFHGGKGGLPETTIRMETPVIYFYPQKAMTVQASVQFPNGTITEVYPPAKSFGYGHADWGEVHIRPEPLSLNLNTERVRSHYYAAREAPAGAVEANGGKEDFLFYRGIGNFDLPMTVTLLGRQLNVSGSRGATFVFERQGDAFGFTVVPPGAHSLVTRPALTGSRVEARGALLEALERAGLYEAEAKAMLATWDDAWFEEGLRVFSLLPSADVDRVLPLTLTPAPTELKRVLIGRIEVLTPERQAAAAREPEKAKEREGRFAQPLLALAAQKASGAERERIERAMYAP